MKTLFAFLLLSISSCVAQLTNLTFSWDADTNATGYRFYEVQGTNRLLLGTSALKTFVVTNWNVSTSRVVSVSATNMLGESAITTPLTVPPAPAPVQNLKPIPLSIVTPVPSVLELSQDLVDWTQRLRLSIGPTSSVQVTWIRYPTEPMMFMRMRIMPPVTFPPLP